MLSSLFKAVGEIRAGKVAERVGEYNANIQKRAAAVARDQAAAEMIQQNRASRKALGSMRAAYGAAGVTVEGSPLDVLAESAATAERDRLTIKYRGDLVALGAEAGAELDLFQGREAKRAGYYRAAGTILAGMEDALKSAGTGGAA